MGEVIIHEKACCSGQEPRVFNPLEPQPPKLMKAVNNICDMMTVCKDKESVITQHAEQQQVESERQTRSKIEKSDGPTRIRTVREGKHPEKEEEHPEEEEPTLRDTIY